MASNTTLMSHPVLSNMGTFFNAKLKLLTQHIREGCPRRLQHIREECPRRLSCCII